MLKKQALKNGDQVKVTFVLPGDHPLANCSVVGEFNQWDPTVSPLRKRSNGTYSAAVTLESTRSYRFRYVTADGHWFDDDEPDHVVPGDAGAVDCVVTT